MRVLGKERKGEKSLESQSAESEGILLMKFTFVRSSLDKGAEKSQCGENEGLHCVFLFFGRERISFDCNLDFFFFEAKEESSSACVVCLSARGLLHWGETSGLYKYVGKGL